MVQAFRRAESVYEAARFTLRGLEPGVRYEFSDIDSGAAQVLEGREAADRGVAVVVPERPGSAVLVYRRE